MLLNKAHNVFAFTGIGDFNGYQLILLIANRPDEIGGLDGIGLGRRRNDQDLLFMAGAEFNPLQGHPLSRWIIEQ